jgi:hypothetical protein
MNNEENKMNNKYICFACGTEFQLLISYMLARTIYKKRKKVILIYKNERVINYLDAIKSSDAWDEKVIFDPTNGKKNDVFQQWIDKIETLHFFTFGFPEFNSFYVDCINHNVKTILTDEGIGSYMPFTRFNNIVAYQEPDRLIVKEIELERIDEIWLLNPDLYCDIITKPMQKIPFEDFIIDLLNETPIAKGLISLFSIGYDFSDKTEKSMKLPQGSHIYFRQYLSYFKNISIDADLFFDNMMVDLLNGNSFLVKNHPAYKENSYKQYKNQLLNSTPWEVLLILSKVYNSDFLKFPRIFISNSSSAMLNSCTLGINGIYIFTNKIIENYTNYRDTTLETLIEKSRSVFTDSQFFQPGSWSELYEIYFNANAKFGLPEPKTPLDVLIKNENIWLSEQYRNQWVDKKELSKKISNLEGEISHLSINYNRVVGEFEELEKRLLDLNTYAEHITSEYNRVVSERFALEQQLTKVVDNGKENLVK